MGNKENWIWPDPLRFGYFLLTSQWVALTGVSFRSLALFSLICFVLLLSTFIFASRLFNKNFAALSVLLLAFSPLSMAMGKRALTDSLGNLFFGLSLWTYLGFLCEKRRGLFFSLFVVFYSYSILIRQQFILFEVFFLVVFFLFKYYYKKALPLAYAVVTVAAPLSIVGATWLFSSSGLADLLMLFKIIRNMPAVNPYSVYFCRGPWTRYLIDYLLLSPWVTLTAFFFVGYALLVNKTILKDPKVGYFLCALIIIYILLSSFDYNKNIRYALCIDTVMRITVVIMLREIFKGKKFMGDIVFGLIVLLCLVDFLSYQYLFVTSNVYDPISYRLLKARLMIP